MRAHSHAPAELAPAEIIHRVLRVKGWNQAQLARATRITQGNISEYLAGKKRPRTRQLERIVAQVGVPLAVAGSLAAWDHLLAETPATQVGSSVPAPGDPLDEASFLREVGEVVLRGLDLLRLELALLSNRAETLWDRLSRFEPKSRPWLVKADPAFWRPSFCLWLCDESERKAADDAGEARELAELAVIVARRFRKAEPRNRFFVRLQGHAEAFLANALRVAGDLAAVEVFRSAWTLWKEGADPDHLLSEARLLDLEASLRRAQRQFADALSLHARALQRARPAEKATILVNQAVTHMIAGEAEAALACLGQAAPPVDRQKQPRLWCVLRHTQALTLLRLERAAEAEPIAAEARALAEQLGNALDRLRARCVAGLVDAGLGRTERAIATLEQVCAEFDQRGHPHDYALVGLDLALLYREKARWADIRKLADRMVTILQVRKIHQETIAAVILFQEAAEKEAVTVELVRRLQDYLKQAQAAPGLPFEAGTGGRKTAPSAE